MGNRLLPFALVLTAAACAQQPVADLPTALHGIEKSKFLSCAGPPQLDIAEGGQEHMAFVSNLTRGAPVGLGAAAAMPVQSCSVDAVFADDRLVSATFGGNRAMCDMVFAPCLPK
jgi:hypothetical protein